MIEFIGGVITGMAIILIVLIVWIGVHYNASEVFDVLFEEKEEDKF